MLCISKIRKQLIEVYDSLYEIKVFNDRCSCVYCGAPRECLDHVPPISFLESISTKKLAELEIDLIKVPCCNKCNSYLGAKRFVTIYERLIYLYERYSKELGNKTLWTDKEISELSGNLKQLVISSQNKIKLEVADRLKGIEESLSDIKKISS